MKPTSPPLRPALPGWQHASVASHAVHMPAAVMAAVRRAPMEYICMLPAKSAARMVVGHNALAACERCQR